MRFQIILGLILVMVFVVDGGFRIRRRRRRGCSRVDCRWSSWSSWSSCSIECGTGGSQTRTRSISRAARCGGSACSGSSSQTQSCSKPCPRGTPIPGGCECPLPYIGTCCRETIKGADPLIMFAERYTVREYDPLKKEYRTIADNQKNAVALDYDIEEKQIYWSDVSLDKIYRTNINGTGVPEVLITGASIPDGISIDWVYRNIYWTDTGTNAIEVASLKDPSKRTILISDNLDEPRAITIEPRIGYMFWTDWGQAAKIERAGMNGQQRLTLVDTDINWPNGLTTDLVSDLLFWVDGQRHSLSSIDYNGQGRRVILQSDSILPHPFAITVFEDYVYWTDWKKGAIIKANKFNGKHTILVENLNRPTGIQIYHPQKQISGIINHCGANNGGCSHLCVAAPQRDDESAKYSCLCPTNSFLMQDGRPCVGTCGIMMTSGKELPRIVGGENAKRGSWPWQVQVLRKGHGHLCGGTLISEDYVISAAHCFSRYSKDLFMVRLGEHDQRIVEGSEQTFDIECLFIHPDYDSVTHNNDIALLKLKRKSNGGAHFGQYVVPACLPRPTKSTEQFNAGHVCWISGWGNTLSTGINSPKILQEAQVPLLARSVCTKQNVYGNRLTDKMFCAGYLKGGIDTCQGDSGGPLVCERDGVWTLYGVTSWGRGCALVNAPGVYTRVSEYINWINQKVKSKVCE